MAGAKAIKVFLDANVILDFTLKRQGYENAQKIFGFAISGQIKAYITTSIVQISGYWLTKAYGADKAKAILLILLLDVSVIDVPHETAVSALHSAINDIEDAIQYYSAIHHKMDYFVSSDKKLQKASMPELQVLDVGAFAKEFEKY